MPDSGTKPHPADVCLLLEGTYPYVLGGVSAWVHQIITGLPDITFSIFYIGAAPDPEAKRHYDVPSNVIEITEVFLHEKLTRREMKPKRLPAEMRTVLYEAFSRFHLAADVPERLDYFWTLLDTLEETRGKLRFGNLLRNREPWEILHDVYDRFCPDESFIDFFWTVRFLHLPLWNLWQSLDRIPRAKMYHSVSAGYAGLVGAIAARRHQVPFLLTEHGIYTKERIAEISQADWIYEPDRFQINYAEGLGKLKQMWINLFFFMGHVAYQTADRIITLYEGNAHTQVEFGADREKIEIIPNGMEPSAFDELYHQQLARWQTNPEKKYIGFIGRVVPIKDVKTLLRAARIVCDKMPNAYFMIAGPYAEDPVYFDECQKIVKMLHIEDRVDFMGRQKIMDVLPKMDVIVLTSISEGLPLVILEGFACGKPVVSTDVGACREMVFGRTIPDRQLGRAGRITKIMSAADTANALVSILDKPETVVKMAKAARARTEQFYSMKQMLDDYRRLYGGKAPDAGVDPRPERPAVINFKMRRPRAANT
jgi:glycosyltransferase involved in cell wall biosynthesis